MRLDVFIGRHERVSTYDVKKQYRHVYAAPVDEFTLVDVPPMSYLAIDGEGDPNSSPVYVAAVQALYSVSYAIRAHCKTELGIVHVVGPLEGLWPSSIVGEPKATWTWTMLINQPDHVTREIVELASAKAKRKTANDAIDRLRLITLKEGLSAQILHHGPYDLEAPTIERLHAEFLPGQGLVPGGEHHEIYLNNPATTEPAKLRTIIRQPVVRPG